MTEAIAYGEAVPGLEELLSPDALTIYKGRSDSPHQVVDGVELHPVDIALKANQPTEALVAPADVEAFAWAFNRCVELGLIEHGVLASAAIHQLAPDCVQCGKVAAYMGGIDPHVRCRNRAGRLELRRRVIMTVYPFSRHPQEEINEAIAKRSPDAYRHQL